MKQNHADIEIQLVNNTKLGQSETDKILTTIRKYTDPEAIKYYRDQVQQGISVSQLEATEGISLELDVNGLPISYSLSNRNSFIEIKKAYELPSVHVQRLYELGYKNKSTKSPLLVVFDPNTNTSASLGYLNKGQLLSDKDPGYKSKVWSEYTPQQQNIAEARQKQLENGMIIIGSEYCPNQQSFAKTLIHEILHIALNSGYHNVYYGQAGINHIFTDIGARINPDQVKKMNNYIKKRF